jgi:hypothetical protein
MGNKEQFTPGPWRKVTYIENELLFVILSGSVTMRSYVCIIDKSCSANGKANANLIAAAPDMYEVLVKIDKYLDSFGAPVGDNNNVRIQIKAALNKANPQ